MFDFSTLKGSQQLLSPFQGANSRFANSGGLRYASTPCYFLTALRAEGGLHDLLDRVTLPFTGHRKSAKQVRIARPADTPRLLCAWRTRANRQFRAVGKIEVIFPLNIN